MADYIKILNNAYDLYRQYGPAIKTMVGKKGSRPFRGGIGRKAMVRYRSVAVPELKYLDNWHQVCPAAGGTLYCLNVLSEGSDFMNRNGRAVFGKAIEFEISINPPSNSGVYDYYEIAFLVDKQSNSALCVYTDVYDTTTIPIGMAFKNVASNASRFAILKQYRGAVCNGSPDLPRVVRATLKIPQNFSRAVYSGSGTWTPESNAIVCVLASVANTGSSTTSWNCNVAARYYFTDI